MVLQGASIGHKMREIIPENHARARMDTGFVIWIVIPVVVGSSPISHPIKSSAQYDCGAIFFVAYCDSI
jgi:hypothetical protein